ncbi:hypothetical protein HUU53_04550 [Candidatus Micrarchaeota archaeon]|nr:hypothetical protein [Candidatus Micrarchaeota archaeon]
MGESYLNIQYRPKVKKGTIHEFTITASEVPSRNTRTIITKKTPKHLKPSLEQVLKQNTRPEATLGTIKYAIEGNTAIPYAAYPVRNLRTETNENEGKGIGSYVEAIITRHLEEQGIKTIKTTRILSPARKRQLQQAFNKEEKEYEKPINEWLRGMGRRIKTGITKSKEE